MTFSKTKKLEKIYNYIRNNSPIEQPKITRHFKEEFNYKSMVCARTCISAFLSELEKEDKIYKEQTKNENTGGLMKNIIYLK